MTPGRIRLLAIVLAAVLPARAAAIDCGPLPKGENPSVDEILKAMEEGSSIYEVPIEVIAGVAYQESGVQQWRADGSFVHNVTDCGLGMMQLTGATAEQFDTDKLKTDWRYNLDAGIQVLCQKWRAAERLYFQKQGLACGDRRIIENWYYAIALYYGARDTSYLRKIFSHMKTRKGPLTKLVREGIDVTIPDDKIQGFAFGKAFVAEAAGFRLPDGQTFKLPITPGTIGNPALNQELDAMVAAARKALEDEQLPKAIRWFKLAQARGGSGRIGQEAGAALKELSKAASAKLAAARELFAKEDVAGALAGLEQVRDGYDGLPEAEAAAQEIEAILADPVWREKQEQLRLEKEARALLEKARRLVEREDFLRAVRAIDRLSASYAATEAAKQAQVLRDKLMGNPETAKSIEDERIAVHWNTRLDLAESYLRNRRFDKAEEIFREVRNDAPTEELKAKGRAGLEKIRKLKDE